MGLGQYGAPRRGPWTGEGVQLLWDRRSLYQPQPGSLKPHCDPTGGWPPGGSRGSPPQDIRGSDKDLDLRPCCLLWDDLAETDRAFVHQQRLCKISCHPEAAVTVSLMDDNPLVPRESSLVPGNRSLLSWACWFGGPIWFFLLLLFVFGHATRDMGS